MSKSIKEYFAAFGKWIFLLAAAVIGDVIGVIQSYARDWIMPQWGWWLILVGILLFSPFIAFHKLKLQRDELQTKLTRMPKLEILDIKDEIPFWETEKRTGQESFWLRLGVKNHGMSPATRCSGKVIKFLSSADNHIGHDLIPLCWIATYTGHSDEQTELRPHEEKYLDVLVQKEKSPKAAYFAAPLRGSIDLLEQVPDNIGRLVIAVYCAETQSIEKEYEIEWKDNAHSYRSLRIKGSTSDKEGSQT